MNKNVKAKWVEALRSGRYVQGNHALHRVSTPDEVWEPVGYCCLGVLCDLAAQEGIVEEREIEERDGEDRVSRFVSVEDDNDQSAVFMPDAVQRWAGIDSINGKMDDSFIHNGIEYFSLSIMNDSGQADFNVIADAIEDRF